ncbi:hypothetical protein M7I_4579 [Glarea lozoyensis 74030]|nr:hypothetical protein M7I_4579 [Glarea lozoyensis 74030]
MKLLIALLLLLTSTLSLAFPTLPPIPDIFNGTSSLAPRNKDGVHCCDNNGRGWKYVPVKKFEPLIHDLKDYYFGNDHNIQLTPGPAACKSLEPCRGGAQILICND